MLSKLLKYDLRANIKIFLFIWPAMLAVAGLQRLLLGLEVDSFLGKFLVALLTVLMLFSMAAVVVLCFIICVIRFYSGLLRREGYLMFTLPVKPWQLLVSKLVAAMLTIIPSCVFAYFGSALILSGTTNDVWSTMFNFKEFFGLHPINGWTLLLAALTVLATLANMILRVYFVSCLGHLFRRARIFLSILFYYLIGILIQVTAVILMVSVTTGRELPFITWFTRLSYNGTMCVFFGGLLLINAAIGCVYFFVSEAILRKRLNLD